MGLGEDVPFSIDVENLPMEKISKMNLNSFQRKELEMPVFRVIAANISGRCGFSLSIETTDCLIDIRSSDWLIDGLHADPSFEDSQEFLNYLVATFIL